MHWFTKFGCFFLLYGPYGIVGTAVLRRRPQLFLVWLLSVLWAYGTYWMTSLLYYSIKPLNSSLSPQSSVSASPQWSPWCSGQVQQVTSNATLSSGWVVVARVVVLWLFHQTFQFTMKTFLLILLLKINSFLRADQQLLVSSRFRFAPVGCAVGLGYGATAMLLSTAPSLLFAETALVGLSSVAKTVTAYDLHTCPQMPVVVHTTLQSLLYSVANMLWGTTHGICVAALFHMGAERVGKLLTWAAFYQFLCPTRVEQEGLVVQDPAMPISTWVSVDKPPHEAAAAAPLGTNTSLPSAGVMRPPLTREEQEGEEDEGVGWGGGAGKEPSAEATAAYRPTTATAGSSHSVANFSRHQGEPLVVDRRAHQGMGEGEGMEEELCCLAESVRCDSEASGPVTGGEPFPPRLPEWAGSLMGPPQDPSVHCITKSGGNNMTAGQQSLLFFIPEDSSFIRHHPIFLLMILGILFLLQLLFTGLTLRLQSGEDRGAYSCSQRLILPNRGCVFSLPLQLVITTFSLLGTLRMTQMEFNPR